jgi:hypothetical protein
VKKKYSEGKPSTVFVNQKSLTLYPCNLYSNKNLTMQRQQRLFPFRDTTFVFKKRASLSVTRATVLTIMKCAKKSKFSKQINFTSESPPPPTPTPKSRGRAHLQQLRGHVRRWRHGTRYPRAPRPHPEPSRPTLIADVSNLPRENINPVDSSQ